MNLEKGTFGVFPVHLLDNLSCYEGYVLSWLWYYANQNTRECWPAQTTLAKKASISVSKLNLVLNSLEEKGLVKRERRTGEQGMQTTLYYVPLQRGDTLFHGEELGNSTTERQTKRRENQTDNTGGFDLRSYLSTWRNLTGGELPASRCASALKKAEAVFSRPVLVSALENYIKETDKRFLSIHRFIQTVGMWVKKECTHQSSLVVSAEDLT